MLFEGWLLLFGDCREDPGVALIMNKIRTGTRKSAGLYSLQNTTTTYVPHVFRTFPLRCRCTCK